MRVGYIREGRPWSIATQAAILVDYGCQTYGVDGPSYRDTTEWLQLLPLLMPGDEVVVASLLVFGSTSHQVNEALIAIAAKGATLINWGEVFHPQPQESRLLVTQSTILDTKETSSIPSNVADRLRDAYIREGWSVTEISDHFLLPETSVKAVLFLTDS